MKAQLSDLALFGGRLEFTDPLMVGRPNLGDRARLHARLDEALDRKWLSNGGPLVTEFEQRIADIAETRHCVAMSSGTIAQQVAMRACGLSGEVIVPALTFAATPHAVEWVGLKPVFCDVEPSTGTLDPGTVSAAVTPATTGIVGVHLWGHPCDVEGLADVAHRHRLTLLFDAAHAFGASYRGKPIGGHGRAEIFSFHATKFVNAFEGGAVTTDDGDLAGRMRRMRNFGLAGSDEVVSAGTNGKMSEASAAMGLTSLDAMTEFVGRNRLNHARYRRELAGVPGIRLIESDDGECQNYQYVVIEVAEDVTGLRRDALMEVLHAENVLARRYFYPGCHSMRPYRSQASGRLPHTERLAERVLALPTGMEVGEEEIAGIAAIIRLSAAHGHELTRQWLARMRPQAMAGSRDPRPGC